MRSDTCIVVTEIQNNMNCGKCLSLFCSLTVKKGSAFREVVVVVVVVVVVEISPRLVRDSS
jgi:hypothetical protein